MPLKKNFLCSWPVISLEVNYTFNSLSLAPHHTFVGNNQSGALNIIECISWYISKENHFLCSSSDTPCLRGWEVATKQHYVDKLLSLVCDRFVSAHTNSIYGISCKFWGFFLIPIPMPNISLVGNFFYRTRYLSLVCF